MAVVSMYSGRRTGTCSNASLFDLNIESKYDILSSRNQTQ